MMIIVIISMVTRSMPSYRSHDQFATMIMIITKSGLNNERDNNPTLYQ
jgi:hypothetical protein